MAAGLAVAAACAVAGWWIAGQHGPPHVAAPPPAGARRVVPAASPSAARSQAPAAHGGVAIAPGVPQGARRRQVAAFLGRYFTAINGHNYQGYARLLGPGMGQSVQQFDQGYGSTVDSGATLTGVSATPGGLAVAVTFTSHQDPADAADGAACTHWSITLYLEPAGPSFLITRPPPYYQAFQESCS